MQLSLLPERTPFGPKEYYLYENDTKETVADSPSPNAFLSPLYPVKFKFQGETFRSVIHYVQAAKHAHNPEYRKLIMRLARPVDALRLGKATPLRHGLNHRVINAQIRKYAPKRHPEWNYSKAKEAMNFATYCKFTQNEALGRALLATRHYPIVESTEEPMWGAERITESGEIIGQNWAGNSVMLVRDMLRNQPHISAG